MKTKDEIALEQIQLYLDNAVESQSPKIRRYFEKQQAWFRIDEDFNISLMLEKSLKKPQQDEIKDAMMGHLASLPCNHFEEVYIQ